MSYSKDPMFLRSIIMQHYDQPTKKVKDVPNGYKNYQNKSSSCIDDITAYIKLDENNKIIKDICFSGLGCAISVSSTDIMANYLIGKNFNQAFTIIDNYLKMVNGQNYDEELLDELIAFYTINEQPNRLKCAQIGINAIANCLKELKSGT